MNDPQPIQLPIPSLRGPDGFPRAIIETIDTGHTSTRYLHYKTWLRQAQLDDLNETPLQPPNRHE